MPNLQTDNHNLEKMDDDDLFNFDLSLPIRHSDHKTTEDMKVNYYQDDEAFVITPKIPLGKTKFTTQVDSQEFLLDDHQEAFDKTTTGFKNPDIRTWESVTEGVGIRYPTLKNE